MAMAVVLFIVAVTRCCWGAVGMLVIVWYWGKELLPPGPVSSSNWQQLYIPWVER